MIGTAIAIGVGVTVVVFACLTVRSDLSRASYYGHTTRIRRRLYESGRESRKRKDVAP